MRSSLPCAAMKFQRITVGSFEVNCSILWGEEKKALIIDPGSDSENIAACLNQNGLTVAAYLLTHGHADHISALNQLRSAHPAPVYMHPAEQKWAFSAMNQIPPYYPVPEKPAGDFQNPCPDTAGSKVWKIADLNFHCLETPGHTPGGVCYWFKEADVCFVGDTLFKGSAGRTDLPGGDARTLTASLKKLAETLPPETRIVAGHGDDTTMAHELATNFFMQRFQP